MGKDKQFWVGPGRNPRGKGQMFQPVPFNSRKAARHVAKTGTSAGRVRSEGGGCRKAAGLFLLFGIVTVLLLGGLVLTGCKPVDAGRGKPVKSQNVIPFPSQSPPSGTLYVTHRVGAEKVQRETVSRVPGHSWERWFNLNSVNPRSADVGATRNFEGSLGCYIWLIRDQRAWLVDYNESVKGGGVACKINEINARAALKKPPQSIENCQCTVGDGDVVLRLVWTA